MRNLWSYVENVWCYVMHPAPMRPVSGQYRCPSCLRQYPVPWEAGHSRWRLQVDPPAPVPVLIERSASGGALAYHSAHEHVPTP
ncbi:MAG: hypothetical protein JNL98_25255 [Bryobacterales bacterium]|nr:hypothetical protein [Bryobacterales bacterium]